jgi:hypothetical protein
MRSTQFVYSTALLSLISVLTVSSATGQKSIEFLGLAGLDVTSLSLYDGVTAVGTNGNSVFWRNEFSEPDSAWRAIKLDSLDVRTVYAHKSGPIGWAIGAGIARTDPSVPLIYCSFLGGEFVASSDGIEDSSATRISSMSGFPDPTICGETYATTDRSIYRRPFGETTWSSIFEATIEGSIQTIVARPEFPGVVLAGGSEGFAGHLLLKSEDFGDTWTDISPLAAVNSVDFAGPKAETIFVATLGDVRRSVDGGTTWETVLLGDVQSSLTHVLYEPSSTSVYVAARESSGVPSIRFSVDDGDTWHIFALSNSEPIVDFRFGGGSAWLYFATAGEGVFRINRSGISVGVDEDQDPSEPITLDQNYPNPLSTQTTIPYAVSRPSHVTLTITDLLGRRIAAWNKWHPSPGQYSIEWSPGPRAQGVYAYTIESDHKKLSRTLTIRH